MKSIKTGMIKLWNSKTGKPEPVDALRGESAYEAAVRLGQFDGTEEEWAQLQAECGDNARAALEAAGRAEESAERAAGSETDALAHANAAADRAAAAAGSASLANYYRELAQNGASQARVSEYQAGQSATRAQSDAALAKRYADQAANDAIMLAGMGARAETLPAGSEATVDLQPDDSMPSGMSLVFGIPQGEDGVLIDDGQVRQDAVWSSENTLNRVFRAFETEGDRVQCYPAAGYPVDAVSRIELVQEGSGDPSPENIRRIVGHTGVRLMHGNAEDPEARVYEADFGKASCSGSYAWKTGLLAEDMLLISLDGTEDWRQISSTPGDPVNYYYMVIGEVNSIVANVAVCSHYKRTTITASTTNVGMNTINSTSSGTARFAFRPDLTLYGTIAAWKQYLAGQAAAGTPVQICWQPSQIVETRLTAAAVCASNGLNTFESTTGATAVSAVGPAEDRRQFLPSRRASSFTWAFGKAILASGAASNNASAALSDPMPVRKNTAIENRTPALDHRGRAFNVFVVELAGGAFRRRVQIASGDIHTTADDTDSIRLLAVYPSSAGSIAMTSTNLMTNFEVGLEGNVASGDGQRPKHVAFGASTTVGAVHHLDGVTPSVSYTPYAWPDYVGQVLGLDTVNLGNGTTGFMARNKGNSPNFMDCIIDNSEILKDADLITLMFGYGNDAASATNLPFGEWDDYFPFDEDPSYRYIEGDADANQQSVAAMVNAGATLTGCLNWSIKWIGEHYPRAVLVCLFGAPSGNSDRKVEVSGGKIVVGARTDPTEEMILAVDALRSKLNIPIINLFSDGLPFSYWSTYARDEDGSYSVFSTKGTAEAPVWNSHPNEAGYLMYARYLAGRISQYFRH